MIKENYRKILNKRYTFREFYNVDVVLKVFLFKTEEARIKFFKDLSEKEECTEIGDGTVGVSQFRTINYESGTIPEYTYILYFELEKVTLQNIILKIMCLNNILYARVGYMRIAGMRYTFMIDIINGFQKRGYSFVFLGDIIEPYEFSIEDKYGYKWDE